MDKFKEKALEKLSSFFKFFKIGVIMALTTALLSIPVSYFTSKTAFKYIFGAPFLLGSIVTTIALFSFAGGRNAFNPEKSKYQALKNKSQANAATQSLEEDPAGSMLRKRENNYTAALEIGIVGVAIYTVAFIIDLIQRAI